jgi:hypothetical protein
MFESCDVICHVTVAFYIYPFMCDTSIDAHSCQLQHFYIQQSTKISKKLKKSQNSLKVTFLSRTSRNCCTDTSKVNQFITIKLRRFWHHRELCSIVEKLSNRDDRFTHTDTQTHEHQFFYCFIVFRDLKNVHKKHKKWVYKKFIFRMNSILRHSDASRNKREKSIIYVYWWTFLRLFSSPASENKKNYGKLFNESGSECFMNQRIQSLMYAESFSDD